MSSDPQTIEQLLQAGRLMHERGWVPATSGNLSLRAGSGALLSPSGVCKGTLRAEALVPVDAQGRSATGTPSAETALHLLIYRRFPEAAAVLHAHSINAVVLSRLVEGDLELQGYELAKALRGVGSHLTAVRVPVIANEQDMALLALQVEAAIDRSGTRWAFVLKGHGVYAWGNSVEEALRHLEALDALFGCQLLELRT